MAKILVLEDDFSMINLIKQWLEIEKHSVDLASSGPVALQLLKKSQYDLLVIDWGVPHVDGLDVTRLYRSSGGTAPVLFLTGKQSIEEKEEAFNGGADDYLTKPFDAREFILRTKVLLRRGGQQSRRSYRLQR